MTENQERWYFRLWQQACKANAWHMQKCRLQNAEPDQAKSDVASAVLGAAAQIAADWHRAPTLDDLRHAVHVAALRRDCPHDKISSKEFWRVRVLLGLLIDPDDLEMMNEWLHPELDQIRTLKGALARFPQGYVISLSEDKFGTKNWEVLPKGDLEKLLWTVNNRTQTRRTKAANPF